MKTLLAAAAVLLVTSSLAAGDENVPDMLEKAMPAVVTVAVRKSTSEVEVRGLVATDVAYEKVLNLGDAESSGSGFVIERNGKKYIVTNAHVVQNASGSGSIVVYSINQSKYQASLAALDSLYDLALLTFEEPPGPEIAAVKFRTGNVRVGETVYAVGNPLGRFPYSVTSGIIGAKNRRFPDQTGKFGYLQSSATVIWGNSGGPLLGADGQVVGVSTRIEFATKGGHTFQQSQLNFALEATLASRLLDEMLANGGRLQRAYLGLELTQDVDESVRPARESPPVIAALLKGSPASQALSGKAGHIVRKIGRTDIGNVDDALQALEQIKPGDTVRIETSAPKSDKIEVATIQAASLDDENAAAIGSFLLEKEVSASMVEKDGAVLLHTSPSTPQFNASMRLKITDLVWQSDKTAVATPARKVTKPPRESKIIAAGTWNDDKLALFRVKNMRDLGIAVKLTAMTGKIDFFYATQDKDNPSLIQVILSRQPDLLQRTLFY